LYRFIELKKPGSISQIVLKCLEGLFLTCQEINEISKFSSSLQAQSDSHLQIINSIDSVQRINDIYLYLINLLLLVQDPSLLEMMNKITISIPSWYKDKATMKVKYFCVYYFFRPFSLTFLLSK
jgi:hypothetical protein